LESGGYNPNPNPGAAAGAALLSSPPAADPTDVNTRLAMALAAELAAKRAFQEAASALGGAPSWPTEQKMAAVCQAVPLSIDNLRVLDDEALRVQDAAAKALLETLAIAMKRARACAAASAAMRAVRQAIKDRRELERMKKEKDDEEGGLWGYGGGD